MAISEVNAIEKYTQIDAALALAGLQELNPSELHGIVVGAICNHLKTGITPDLMRLVEPSSDALQSSLKPVNDLVYGLYRDMSELLFENKEGFELILPGEGESLSLRTESVATWCKGYLLGLLYNDQFSLDQLPENGAEIARDFMEISEAAAGSDSEQEEDWALAELEEYVKVGAQLIFEFIYSERAADAPSQTH